MILAKLTRMCFALAGVSALAALPLLGAGDSATPSKPGEAHTAPVAGPRVKALFLGDNGHHKPLERYRQVAVGMTMRGVDLTYTDDLSQITPANLARFDCLVLYANITKAPPEVEKAILDYVASGKGYAVLHCGSFCWLNSTPLTELAGGRFKRHGTGVFKETFTQPDSPVLKGLSPIESWDETYVHEMHNEKDRQVVSVREDKEGKEPYTWTRTHGKGRVFYTAWGHDERTWGNADYQNLMERGIRWAAGDAFLAPKTTFPPFEYGEGRAPNYLASKQWGAQGSEITKIQKPLPPEQSVKHMVLPPKVEARLYASDPKIFKPIAMAFDERGRVWISETFDYPNEMQEPGKGRDRISILEDTDGDGVADKFTVFADKLSIPTSLCFANGGLIVSQAPDMLFLKDTDGDGVADVRKTLFTGWGTNDTHAGPSNLRYGLDNWVYGIVGYSGFNGEVGGEKLRFAQGIWRMKPDGSKVEFLGNLTNNAWGLGFSEEGHIFASTANNAPSFYLHIPNRAYESVRGWPVRRLENIADLNKMFVATDAIRQVDAHGNYTAGAGHALYTARTWPSYYWNRVSFVAEPTGHIVGQFLLQPQGTQFVARNDASLVSSTDEWTSPIVAEVGPDGNMWVIDWYNFIVQHNPTPKGWSTGRGNAYETNLRDKTHGRIYRLNYADGTPSKTFNLTKADNATLLAALKSDNQLWRLHGQRLLVEKGDKSVAGELIKLSADSSVDAIGLNTGAIHALWTLQGLGLLDGSNADANAAAVAALKHPSAGVRKAAVETLPRTEAGLAALIAANSLADASLQVRKSALLAIAEMPQGSTEAGKAVHAALSVPGTAEDRWLPEAATIAAARHDAAFLAAALAAYKLPDGAPKVEQPAAKNLMPNPSFELDNANVPVGWKPRNYSGRASAEVSESVSHSGKRSLVLKSDTGSDTSWYTDVPVEPNTRYRLSCWIKTDNIKTLRGGMGAMLNVHTTDFKTRAITGTKDWEKVEIVFNSGRARTVSINLLYGGWGHATGTAYYDDIELSKVAGSVGLPGVDGQVLSAVITHYASRVPKDSVVGTLKSVKSAQPAMATVVIDALAAAWPEGAANAPELSADDAKELQTVIAALPPAARDRLLALAGKWHKADIFGDALASAMKELVAKVDDVKLSPSERGQAARRLIAVADNADNAGLIIKHINAAAGPDVQRELLAALGDSRETTVGQKLIAQWPKISPAAQSAALPLMLRREPWTLALLSGVKANTINAKDILPQQWQSMTTHSNQQIVNQAKAIQRSSGQTVSADRKAIVDKLLPLADKAGDVAKGKLVFEKNCAVCHVLEGKGGKVGPELTGVGARPKADILMEVLDPNRSVEGTYRVWSARTTDDDVIAGRLISESQTSVEIIDATGVVHAIQRDKLKSMTASDRSVMPEGFEALAPEDLTNLVEFLATSKVKH